MENLKIKLKLEKNILNESIKTIEKSYQQWNIDFKKHIENKSIKTEQLEIIINKYNEKTEYMFKNYNFEKYAEFIFLMCIELEQPPECKYLAYHIFKKYK